MGKEDCGLPSFSLLPNLGIQYESVVLHSESISELYVTWLTAEKSYWETTGYCAVEILGYE